MPKGNPKRNYTLTLSPKIVEKLDKKVKQLGLNRSDYVEFLIIKDLGLMQGGSKE